MERVVVRGDRPGVASSLVSLVRPGAALLVSGLPGVGKTTLASALATLAGAVCVSIPAGLLRRSTSLSRADRVVRALDAVHEGRAVILDATARGDARLAYWTARLPVCAVVEVVVDEPLRRARLTERRRAAR